jgi:mannose-1-phosphate guanylyltransferase
MIGEFEAHAPDLLAQARRAYQDSAPTRHLVQLAEPSFRECNAISVDYAIMEKSKRVSVVPVGYAWSDLGSWASIWETAAKDADGNAVEGPVKAVECRNCLIFSDGPAISVMGLTDMIIVAANGRNMMLPRSHSVRVGEMARADLKKAP